MKAGIWERVNNPDFNCVEFDTIKSQTATGMMNTL